MRRGSLIGRLAVLGAGFCLTLGGLQSSASADSRQTDLQSFGAIGGNGAFGVTYGGISQDGTKVFFTSSEQLVAADTDTAVDLYQRAAGVTTRLSAGPAGGNSSLDNAIFDGSSTDGSIVYFSTTEPLTTGDTDDFRDVYRASGGTTTLMSVGPTGGNGAIDAFYLGNSDDGGTLFFDTIERLTSDDTDSFQDVYQGAGGATTRLTTGPAGGNGATDSFYLAHSGDGSHFLFQTAEAMVAGDTDGGFQDVYERSGGTTTLVSNGPAGTNAALDAAFGGANPDTSHVFFTTREVLVSGDTDTARDVYDYSGGTTTRVSAGATNGNGNSSAFYSGTSQDGSRVWFESREALVAGDTDGGCLNVNGDPVLPCNDVYERSGGSTTQTSCCGNGPKDAFFAGAALDGARVFFRTGEALSAGDTDGTYQDIYQRSGGVTTQMSTGPIGNGPHDVFFAGNSADGARVFFQTYESLVAADTDGSYQDVYERYAGDTTLVSTGQATTNASEIASYDGSTPDGTKVFFDTAEVLNGPDTDSSVDVYSSTQTVSGFPRPKGATPTRFSFVPAYQQCSGGTLTHGPPLAYPSCTHAQSSAVLTVGSPDANVHSAASNSGIKLRVIPGAPGPPEDSNVEFTIAVTDVLCRTTNAACPGAAFADYAGKVLAQLTLRVTDKYSGSPLVEGATTQDFDLGIPVQCVTTASALEGGKCETITTANALYPGAVLDTRRTIWDLGQARILDPGPNGTGFGAGCPATCGDGDETVFMRQGIFIPD